MPKFMATVYLEADSFEVAERRLQERIGHDEKITVSPMFQVLDVDQLKDLTKPPEDGS